MSHSYIAVNPSGNIHRDYNTIELELIAYTFFTIDAKCRECDYVFINIRIPRGQTPQDYIFFVSCVNCGNHGGLIRIVK